MATDPALSALLAQAAQVALWSGLTIGFYLLAKRAYRRWPHWWSMPLLVAPVLLMIAVQAFHSSYAAYIHGSGWLVMLMGPATVAFAVPIYEQRALIRSIWPVLLVGMLVGSATAIAVSWGLATLLDLDGTLRLSLLPRSISTPFAMQVSSEIGGVPDLTAVFVVVTGILGAAMGDLILGWVPVKSALARGALFGVAAHGAGTARATQIGRVEGTIAGLVMVLVGLLNVLVSPLLGLIVH